MDTDTSSIHQENKPGDSIYIPGKSQASINVRVSEVVQRGYRFKYGLIDYVKRIAGKTSKLRT